MGKPASVQFYATEEDLAQVFGEFERELNVKYVEGRFYDHPSNVVFFQSAAEIPNFGMSMFGSMLGDPQYFLMEENNPVNIVPVVKRKSNEVHYDVGGVYNSNFIVLRFGGIYANQEKTLISGEISIAEAGEREVTMFKKLRSSLRKRFSKYSYYDIGPVAKGLWATGWRLRPHYAAEMHELRIGMF